MKEYIIIAGINGTGKSSIRGVLEGEGKNLGYIIDADLIAKENNYDNIKSGKQAVSEINFCLENNLSFTQETTLSGKRTQKTIKQAKKQGYYVTMYYIGLNSVEESLSRIANRVRKGGHDIPKEYVIHRHHNRIQALENVLPLCDKVIFYDNEYGFVKAAEITNHKFLYTNGLRPEWLCEIVKQLGIRS